MKRCIMGYMKFPPLFQSLVGFRILWAVFEIPKPRIPNSTSKNFPYSKIRILLHGAIGAKRVCLKKFPDFWKLLVVSMNQNMVTAMFASLTRNKIDSFYISFTINYDSRIKNRILFNTILNWFQFHQSIFQNLCRVLSYVNWQIHFFSVRILALILSYW